MTKSRVFIFTATSLLLLGGVIIIYYYSQVRDADRTGQATLEGGSESYMQVGQETIYVQDFHTELSSHPQRDDPKVQRMLQEKLIKDSVTLQEAEAEGIIELTPNVFGSLDKNYEERVALVAYVEELKNNASVVIHGEIIAIWFYNNDYIGPLGLEGQKLKAYETISRLQRQIVNGEISLFDAGQMIANDQSLREVDLAWTNNAYYEFSAGINDQITIDPDFDKMVRSLNEGETSSVYLARNSDVDPEKQVDALYYVARVNTKTNPTGASTTNDYSTWLMSVMNKYDVVYQ